jgi:hypothetical protein
MKMFGKLINSLLSHLALSLYDSYLNDNKTSNELMPKLEKNNPNMKLTGSWRSEIGALDNYGKHLCIQCIFFKNLISTTNSSSFMAI